MAAISAAPKQQQSICQIKFTPIDGLDRTEITIEDFDVPFRLYVPNPTPSQKERLTQTLSKIPCRLITVRNVLTHEKVQGTNTLEETIDALDSVIKQIFKSEA